MGNNKINFRINLLDSFRAIAIIMVLFFHYFSRWINLYPYSTKYDFFSYGKMGVHLFFIISGFVILYTLENTNNFIVFWKKRIIRLFPSMLIASLITFSVVNLIDDKLLFPTSHSFKNVLASISFMPPDLLAKILNFKSGLDYTSACYWSLWPEIQFYLFVSTIFFLNKKNFSKIFFMLTFILVIINYMFNNIWTQNSLVIKINPYLKVFNLIEALPFFCFGVLFYYFYKNKILGEKISNFLKIYFIIFFLFYVYMNHSLLLKLLLILVFFTLFIALIYFPKSIGILENKLVIKIGISSYFLYLIHENIGVLLIHKYGNNLKLFDFVFPIVVILLMVFFSIQYTFNLEKKINNFLNRKFLKK